MSSTIEGFKRGIGIEARELILPKLLTDKEATVHILLTHSSSQFDIYNHYKQHHFQKAWEDRNLSTQDAGFSFSGNDNRKVRAVVG